MENIERTTLYTAELSIFLRELEEFTSLEVTNVEQVIKGTNIDEQEALCIKYQSWAT